MLRLLLLVALPAAVAAQGPFPQPKTFPPDEATLAKIKDKTEELRKAVGALPHERNAYGLADDVKVFLKAADWMVRHGEWYTDKTAQQTLDVLDAGLKRAVSLRACQELTPPTPADGIPVGHEEHRPRRRDSATARRTVAGARRAATPPVGGL